MQWHICAHLCTIQTKHRLYFPHSSLKLINLQRNRKYNCMFFCFPPCAAGSIHSWLFRLREINQVAPCGPPTNLESFEKIKICATKLKKSYLVCFRIHYKSKGRNVVLVQDTFWEVQCCTNPS